MAGAGALPANSCNPHLSCPGLGSCLSGRLLAAQRQAVGLTGSPAALTQSPLQARQTDRPSQLQENEEVLLEFLEGLTYAHPSSPTNHVHTQIHKLTQLTHLQKLPQGGLGAAPLGGPPP